MPVRPPPLGQHVRRRLPEAASRARRSAARRTPRRSSSRSSGRTRAVYMPPEETKTTRRGNGGAQLRREQAGEQQRAEDVGGERQLMALGGAPALVYEHTGVVDDAAQVRAALAKASDEIADRFQVGEVALPDLRRPSVRRQPASDAPRGGHEAVVVAADHVYAGAAGREPGGRRLSDSGARSGDDHVGAGDARDGRRSAPGSRSAADSRARRSPARRRDPAPGRAAPAGFVREGRAWVS